MSPLGKRPTQKLTETTLCHRQKGFFDISLRDLFPFLQTTRLLIFADESRWLET